MSNTIILKPQVGLSNTQWLMKVKEEGIYIYFDSIHFGDNTDTLLEFRRNGLDSSVAIIDMANYNTKVSSVLSRFEEDKRIQLYQ